jgi:dimethylargininase
MITAITRQVSPTLAGCNLTFIPREPIDVDKAIAQHRAYEQCLRDLGAEVVSLAADPRFPDAVFVEDPAIVLDEIAVILRMGAESRRGEEVTLAEALTPYRDLVWIREPATIDGGDVIRIGKRLFVGQSQRTNREGCAQLQTLLQAFGYEVAAVPVHGCLHLKSACCYVGDDTVLINRAWIDASFFAGFKNIDVAEPWSADVLRLGDTVIIPDGFPKTRERLESCGFQTQAIDVSELQKAEAGVTCMSLIIE